MKHLLQRLGCGAGLLLALAGAAPAQSRLDLNRPTYYPRVICLTQGGNADRLLASFDVGKAGSIYESPAAGQPQGRLLAMGQLLLNNTDNAVAAANGRV